jgi:hypothetical protein
MNKLQRKSKDFVFQKVSVDGKWGKAFPEKLSGRLAAYPGPTQGFA